MNTTADQINARLIAARCCDALDPCESCRAGRALYFQKRREEREGVKVPAPRTGGSLRERLAAVAS